MDNWLEYQDERQSDQHERRERLLEQLEIGEELPDQPLLKSLSGLLDADLDEVKDRWGHQKLELRRALIHELSDLADADFKLDFSAVFRLALQDDDAEIRAASVLGLREIQDARLIPILTHMLREDPSPAARAAAATVLGEYVLLGELAKIRPGPFESAVSALRESCLDGAEKSEVQQQALKSIAYTAEGGAADLILEAYGSANEAMQISAVHAMGRSADGRWGKIVQRELSSTNPTMRLEATRAAGELQLHDAAAEVAALTDDVDQAVRLMALWALGQIGGVVARKTLDDFSTSDDPALQTAAQEAIRELEFFEGDPNSFFGPPSDFSGDAEEPWGLDGLLGIDIDDEDSEDDDDTWD